MDSDYYDDFMDSDYYDDFMDSDYYADFVLLFSIATNKVLKPPVCLLVLRICGNISMQHQRTSTQQELQLVQLHTCRIHACAVCMCVLLFVRG